MPLTHGKQAGHTGREPQRTALSGFNKVYNIAPREAVQDLQFPNSFTIVK